MKHGTRQRSNFNPSMSRNWFTLAHTHCPNAQVFLLRCLKEFSHTVQDERLRRREPDRGKGRGRNRLEIFSTSLHFFLAPRGFSKAFRKKTSSCMMDQTAAAAMSQPTQQSASFDTSVTISTCVASFLNTVG